ncbi:hemolysin secretion protein D [Frateuria sp. Soil773]|uniref:HlyD family type I secretion periplasmic adaptor subunit n=1 Tax=Frateuria sp. Soil773 TaxID=1736407 RepID=UPI0006F838C3|nr:HlyD family type I secretion periplasmic adaptor subunit [Frateuria sp. Soil773]KRE89336.1 hemolysin secretion protein D [Frateuria sp. Soil773]
MTHRLEALLDVARRYGEVFRAAWAERKQLEPVRRTREELAFLPAHLELTDTPLSPAPRWSMRIIVALFAVALLWACFGRLDIVAVAPGKIVSSGRTKVIQPMETSVVRRILVQDGQAVKRGDLLVELDAVGVEADAAKAADALVSARLTAMRAAAVVAAIDAGTPPQLAAEDGLPEAGLKAARQLAGSEFATFQAKRQGLEAAIAQKQAELHTVEASIDPLAQYAQIARARVDDYKKLLAKEYVSRQDYLTREQERINAERDLASQRNRRLELLSAIAGAREELALTVADTRRQLLDEERQAREQIRQSAPDVARTSQRDALMQLRAPVDGTVQQLDIHTIGGVVTPAQPLLSIVPAEESLEAEATVFNKDIGFVRPGQAVTLKLDSFPYTRYGYVTGTVVVVSHDAVKDEKLGLLFPVRIRLDRAFLDIDGAKVGITPGMSLSAEIKTGKRKVIDYLLSPLHQQGAEAMRER